MAPRVSMMLMFSGEAESAMELYSSIYSSFSVESVERFAPGEPGAGTVKQGVVNFGGQRLIFFDSYVQHAFTFTPSISFFLDVENEAEQSRIFGVLAEGGEVLMPLDAYGFSRRFGWCNDRFGVSWQINVP